MMKNYPFREQPEFFLVLLKLAITVCVHRFEIT